MRTWNLTAHALPEEGDVVQFVVEHRNIVLHGVYEEAAFKSRWSTYPSEDVCEWRKLGEAPAAWSLALKMPEARADYVPVAARSSASMSSPMTAS